MRKIVLILTGLALVAGAGAATASANFPADNGSGMCAEHYTGHAIFRVPCR